MASVVKPQYAGSVVDFTITLASLASSTAGVGRQATMIDNTTNLYMDAIISANIMVGTTPTINSLLYVYLLRSDNNGTAITDDNAGASDAGLTFINAPLLGTMLVPATTSNVAYKRLFDTRSIPGLILPAKWTVGVVNASGVALNSTGGNHKISYVGFNPQIV